MSLTRLLIRDFRNIETADLALSPGFNFLVGANGSGKTSVLESHLYARPRSGVSQLQIGRVIRHEQEAFVLHRRLQGEERETAIGLTKDKQGDSKVRIDGTDGHKVAGSGAPDANAADNARRVYFTQRRPQIQKSIPRLGMLSQRTRIFHRLEQSQAIAQAAQCGAAPGDSLRTATSVG
ncbi:AAA family ATPase [Escherichia coli]|nr:AAA family ATPase [Escherichia coli]